MRRCAGGPHSLEIFLASISRGLLAAHVSRTNLTVSFADA
jgi:hypothetical protein